ncbi:hypothetical protein K2185_05365, partial [Klebsiella sp. K5-312]|uniref:hypothetical protein n=1 Tax=Klebsiella sp. K5-312 TaxID=2866567 RepID=UPI003F6DFAF2
MSRVFPEAARCACPGYRPADGGGLLARVSAAGKRPHRCIYPGATQATDLQLPGSATGKTEKSDNKKPRIAPGLAITR